MQKTSGTGASPGKQPETHGLYIAGHFWPLSWMVFSLRSSPSKKALRGYGGGRRLWVIVVAVLAIPGCRWGYDSIDSVHDGESTNVALGGADAAELGSQSPPGSGGSSGGMTGSGAAPSTSGAGGTSLMGSGGSGGTVDGAGGASMDSVGPGGEVVSVPAADFVVNSMLDPTEGGKLTLRDAVLAANASGLAKTISFEQGLGTIAMTGPLPNHDVSIGIYGSDQVIDFASATGVVGCIRQISGSLVLSGVHIAGCPDASIRLEGGANHSVSHCTFSDYRNPLVIDAAVSDVTIGPGNSFSGASDGVLGIRVRGDRVQIVENTFLNAAGTNNAVVLIDSDAADAFVAGNVIAGGGSGVHLNGNVSDAKIYHNTIVRVNTAVRATQATGMDIRNNVFVDATGTAFFVNSDVTSRLTAFDYNLFFGNAEDCDACPSGLGSNSVSSDPLFADPSGDDFDLLSGSPAIDAGDASVSHDQNNAASGNWFGLAPDIGAYETNR